MVLTRWHLQEVLSHSYAEHQWTLGEPSLNATYKLLTSLSKVPMLMVFKVPNSSQLNRDNHSWFHLAPSSSPHHPNAHSAPGMAQSSFYTLNDQVLLPRRVTSKRLKTIDMMLYHQGTSWESCTAPDTMQCTQQPKKKCPTLYLIPS